jgi:asparagine synthase (glutamine-hydrolysing)
MCDRLRHRGPDDEGYYSDGPVTLGQRRLAIVDLVTGRQPMANEARTVWVTFNGEIYNFASLRRRLEGLGHRFATQSDTEVIPHAWEQYGPECIGYLRGMFAVALWDASARTLFLARDRVGKKPLFYAVAGTQFVFASELHALIGHAGVDRTIDEEAVDDYLTFGYIPAPRTIFKNVWKVAPAHHITLRLDAADPTPRIERYWRLPYGPKLDLAEDDAGEELLSRLREAVRLRLIADVPLGALLSGGVDSSVVVALMSQLSDKRVKTFSIGFEESAFNELSYARNVADRFATDHHELVVRPDAVSVLPTLVRHYAEPYADSSALPSYYVAKLTRDHVTVALNGDGGDECFAGYERYLGMQMAEQYQRLPQVLRHGVIEPLGRWLPSAAPRRSRLRQLRSLLQAAGQSPASRYVRWMSQVRPEFRSALYTPELQHRLAGHRSQQWLEDLWDHRAAEGLHGVDVPLAVDVESYLPNDLLVKMDIATMANSLEARSPFLDHEVMEFCARLPTHYKLRGLTLKYLLKKAGGRYLPPEILRRRKMGFGVPVGYWMRGELRPWVEELLLSSTSLKRGYFRPEIVRGMVERHLGGREDLSSELWALLWLELWHREFMD